MWKPRSTRCVQHGELYVFRYILYKELMTKDQSLEMCRAQIKRLQGELKLLNIENSILSEKLDKNNPEVLRLISDILFQIWLVQKKYH